MATTGLDSGVALTYLRQTLSDNDTSGSGRWTQQTLLNFIDRANKRAVRDVLFPDCRVAVPSVPGVQLYQFPLMLKVKAVYVAGELIVPSDLPTLEGRQTGRWDMSADGSRQPAPYGDQAIGTTGVGSPAWTVAEPLSYPSTNGQWTTPAPDAEPWLSGSRARYYWRGGWLGLVGLPANQVTIEVDGVRQPDTITYTVNGSGIFVPQILTTPDNFLDAIMWAAVSLAKFADDGSRADAQMKTAEQNYEREKRKLMEWRGEYIGEQRNGPKPQVLRPGQLRLSKSGR